MKELWTLRWKKALLWLCGYVNLIAFAVAGGYVIVKSTDKELQRTAKLVFVIVLLFTAVEALIAILSGIAALGARMGSALTWIGFFVTLFRIAVFAAGIVMELFFPKALEKLLAPRGKKAAEEKADTDRPAEAQAQPEEDRGEPSEE